MIVKFERITGENLATLLIFIHGDENKVPVYQSGLGRTVEHTIVHIKATKPDHHGDDTWYNITLDILEWLPRADDSGQKDRVDPKYFLKVYEILGQAKYPPISPGTKLHRES